MLQAIFVCLDIKIIIMEVVELDVYLYSLTFGLELENTNNLKDSFFDVENLDIGLECARRNCSIVHHAVDLVSEELGRALLQPMTLPGLLVDAFQPLRDEFYSLHFPKFIFKFFSSWTAKN